MRGNSIQEEGAHSLARAMAVDDGLEELDVGSNEVVASCWIASVFIALHACIAAVG